MIPAENPKANIPIFTGDDTSPHRTTEVVTAITRNSSAVAISALFDFILSSEIFIPAMTGTQ
jgi:hypothetical protein